MTKTVTSTGLVRIEYHGQVWFDNPGHTEVVFQRLHIETNHAFNIPRGTSTEETPPSPGRIGVRSNSKRP